MAKKKTVEKVPIPAYMTSFADMMTIVLTFFILLYSYASERQFGAVQERADAFNAAIEALGLPGLMASGQKPVNLHGEKPKFPPFPGKKKTQKEDDKPLSSLPTLMGVQVKKFKRIYSANIILPRFAKKKSLLSKPHKKFLRGFFSLIRKKKFVNVIGYADSKSSSPKKDISLAFKRALVVASYLHKEGKLKPIQIRPIAKISEAAKGQIVEISFEEF